MKRAACFALLLAASLLLCAAAQAPVRKDLSLSELRRRAEGGDPRARTLLGMSFRNGEQGGPDYAEARRWFDLAAEAGDPVALCHLASMHESGVLGEVDTALARRLYARSLPALREQAASGDPVAMAHLGLLHNLGIGTARNPDSALHWALEAARAGDAAAQYYAGFYYHHGAGTERDDVRAAEWLEKSAGQGDHRAEALLGNILYNGWGLPRDVQRAKGLFLQAETWPSAAESSRDGVYHYGGVPQVGDEIIPGLCPPRSRLQITEGDCGEACLWTLLRKWGHETTEIQINEDAGNPGRGLHAYELHRVLDRYGLDYRDTMGRPPRAYIPLLVRSLFNRKSAADRERLYRDFLYDEVIASVRRGIPVILGVKSFPDRDRLNPLDHFILIVGYNEDSGELIFNSHNRRERIRASKLLDTSDGYSLWNFYDVTSALFVPLPHSPYMSTISCLVLPRMPYFFPTFRKASSPLSR